MVTKTFEIMKYLFRFFVVITRGIPGEKKLNKFESECENEGKVHILVNFPSDTSLTNKVHSA